MHFLPEIPFKPLLLPEEVDVYESLGLFESVSCCWLCILEYAPWVLSDSPYQVDVKGEEEEADWFFFFF